MLIFSTNKELITKDSKDINQLITNYLTLFHIY